MEPREGSHRNSGAFSGTPASVRLAGLLAQAAGPGERYPLADDGAVVTAAGRWDALESWAAARVLAAIRELVRRNPADGCKAGDGGLPAVWRKELCEEIGCELGISKIAADKLIDLAWVLETRLPLAGAALDAGVLSLAKARLVADETRVLSDADAAAAEALVAGWWDRKTWTQLQKKIALAVVQVDPEGARKRREAAEREDARVRFWREQAGTAALAGYGLPADEALKAMQHITNRARAYKRHGIGFPMDQLRVLAMLDLLNGTDSRARYPKAAPAGNRGPAGARPGTGTGQDGRAPDDTDHDARDSQDAEDEDSGAQDPEDSDGQDDADGPGWDDEPEDGGPEDDEDGPEDGGPGNGGPGSGPAPGGTGGGGADDGLAANVDLTIPLTGLLGPAGRPGEAHGLGVLDPALARQLTAQAAKNPRSVFTIIITDPAGHAIGYGQAARTRRKRKPSAAPPPEPGQPARTGPVRSPDGTPVTFTPAGPGPLGPPRPDGQPGPGGPGGYGTWTLAIGDLELTVTLAPIPAGECDHRYQTAGHQPGAALRRLVQIRDGECTLPVCVRHPRSCEWEHTVPWPQGPTCACNGAMRCRHDHRVKEKWQVRQLPGGWHQWTTPSGLTYTKGPKEYPI